MEEQVAIHTLQYLYSIDTCLTGIAGLDNKLRQNYLQRAKILESKEGIALPNKTIKPRVKCPKCCMPRTHGLAEFRLHRNARQNRFLTRLKRKIQEGKLTKYQQRFLIKKKGMLDQVQSIHCKVCKHVVTEPIAKPNFLKIKPEQDFHSKARPDKKCMKNENKQTTFKQFNNKYITMNTNVPLKKQNDSNNGKGKGKVVKQQVNKNNKRQQNKMQSMLVSACKLKSTNLKDFIKSVT